MYGYIYMRIQNVCIYTYICMCVGVCAGMYVCLSMRLYACVLFSFVGFLLFFYSAITPLKTDLYEADGRPRL